MPLDSKLAGRAEPGGSPAQQVVDGPTTNLAEWLLPKLASRREWSIFVREYDGAHILAPAPINSRVGVISHAVGGTDEGNEFHLAAIGDGDPIVFARGSAGCWNMTTSKRPRAVTAKFSTDGDLFREWYMTRSPREDTGSMDTLVSSLPVLWQGAHATRQVLPWTRRTHARSSLHDVGV